MIFRQLLIALAENHQKEAVQAAKVKVKSVQRKHQNPKELKDEIVPGGWIALSCLGEQLTPSPNFGMASSFHGEDQIHG